MNLKQALLESLSKDNLKALCEELEVDADRRSAEAMQAALRSAKRAKPDRLIEVMGVVELRMALETLGESLQGSKGDLIVRLMAVNARNGSDSVPVSTAQDSSPADYLAVRRPRGRGVQAADETAQYRHRDEAVQRPDAGVQDQFQAKKLPKTYRYDSSLDPALSWDEQRERDLGEWLLGLIVRAGKEGEKAVFAEPQVWKGGGVRLESTADAARLLESISKPFLNWAGKAERHQINVPTVPLFVHERHSTKAILDGIRHRKARGQSLDLFGDSQMDIRENLEAYEHKGPWQNRMILGDSLSVMNSLLEFEGMAGQVQMIYVDPPYGVKFGSNFQPFVRKREVKHAVDAEMTREPEMVKAYRDTWELGLHSYLTYLRDRIQVGRELLRSTGAIFVQIGVENRHHVRELLDEILGPENFVSEITFVKTSSSTGDFVPRTTDYLICYAKDISRLKYRSIYVRKEFGGKGATGYNRVRLRDGATRALTVDERETGELEEGSKLYCLDNLTSQSIGREKGEGAACWFPISLGGKSYLPPATARWKTNEAGMSRLIDADRVEGVGSRAGYVRYWTDFPYFPISDLWDDVMPSFMSDKLYVVQTSAKVVARCMLMTTEPGDLVLDPTCGSGTTALVAEEWGRRWITCDTSRVPLALARQRLLTATFPYYELKSQQLGPLGGFVYQQKRNRKGEEIGGLVPHVTLKSIASNEPPATEVLVDQPEELSGVTRVAGPFVVEATVAPVQSLDIAGDDSTADSDASTHIQRMTEVLRQSKTLHLPGNRELVLSGIRRTVDTEYLHAEAKEGDNRVAIVFGPADGAVSATLVYEAGREAHYLKYERLYFFGFAVEPNARAMIDDERKLRIPAAYVAVTPDVAMSDLLKTTRASEIFSVTGLPDVRVRQAKRRGAEGQALYEVELKGLDLFDPESMETESIGGENVPCWMLDTDYDGLSFYAAQVFFPKTSAWDNLQRSLKAAFDESVWSHLAGTVSEPFAVGDRKRVAVKVIDERGNELMRVLNVAE